MKYTLLIFGIATLFSSCKKTYTCECNAYSTQEVVFTEYQTVKAYNKKKADEECIKVGAYYDYSHYPNQNIQFVNCNYKK